MSIRVKLALVIVFVVVLSTGSLGTFLVEQGRDMILQKTIQLCHSNASALANIAEDNLLTGVYAPVQDFINRIMEVGIEGLTLAYVVDNDGRVIAHSDIQKINTSIDRQTKTHISKVNVFEHFETESPDGDPLLEFVNPIWIMHEKRQTRIGTTVMRFSTDEIFASIEEAKKLIFVTTCIVLVLSLFVVVLTSHFLAKPILTLSKAAQNVSEGNLDTQVSITSRDELGMLANDFNQMTKGLKKAREELIEKTRMQHELKTARLVQDTLFPREDLSLSTIDLTGSFRPASETGGDWFSYLEDEESHSVSVLIGDVSGHGAPAALVCATANSMVSYLNEKKEYLHLVQRLSKLSLKGNGGVTKEMASIQKQVPTNPLNPSNILQDLNNIIYRLSSGNSPGLTMTFFASLYNTKTREIHFSNAGHTFPLLWQNGEGGNGRKGGRVSTLISERNLRLGETRNVKFTEEKRKLAPSETLLWYTDGLIDCQNPQGDRFGKKRLRAVMEKNSRFPVKKFRENLNQTVDEFIQKQPLEDDIAVVIGKVK